MNARLIAAVAASLGLAAIASLAGAQQTAPAGDPVHGRTEFIAQGCYECHGYVGQGTGHRGPGQFPGPNLAPAPIPYAAYLHQLRAPRSEMPPYAAVILNDTDAADIYAFLEAVPARKDATTIPILAKLAGAGPAVGASRGKVLFGDNCATCHGVAGANGTLGPSLVNEKSKHDLAATIATIKNPAPGMTKLYPGMLTDDDVKAIATYVQSL
jgi:ubiquinol-cytochrome c reductase cytochrome c subunit